MLIRQAVLDDLSTDQLVKLAALEDITPQLVLVFGSIKLIDQAPLLTQLAQRFPEAQRVGCSTAGEVYTVGVAQGSIVVTALHFDHPSFRVATTELTAMDASHEAGTQLANGLTAPDLKAVWVFCQGVNINGSALVEGMISQLGHGVQICGGLAGDDGAFKSSLTLCNAGVSATRLVAIGFYGDTLIHSHGSFGGWHAFGQERQVTRCDGNVLYELDGEPALSVYKRYLGDHAKGLPSSGLLFPFEMTGRLQSPDSRVIRTILGINEASGSLILAGEIYLGCQLRLMYSHTDKLIDGARDAANLTRQLLPPHTGPSLALLVSCIGRKLVMGKHVSEEVSAVARVLEGNVSLAGFYSYGEISPDADTLQCELHNQTMTIAYLAEADDGL